MKNSKNSIKVRLGLLTLGLVLLAENVNAGAGVKTSVRIPIKQGKNLGLDFYNAGQDSVVLYMPGTACNNPSKLFQHIADGADRSGWTLAKIKWSFCLSDPQKTPSDHWKAEERELRAALAYLKNDLKYPPERIVLMAKSSANFLAHNFFQKEKRLQSFVMLSPPCTLNKMEAFYELYPDLESESRIVMIAKGSADPRCNSEHLYSFLQGLNENFLTLNLPGNEEFSYVFQGRDQTEKNQALVSQWIFNWLGK